MATSIPAQLPAPRIVIAANNEDGRSVIASDHHMKLFGPFGPNGSQFTSLYTTDTIPASNTAPLPSSTTTSIPRPPKNGTVFCTSDMAPGSSSPFHRTTTVDYMVVLKGEIVLRVNDGVETTIREGEMMVQRGTIHSWHNRSDQWCRMLVVMVDAEKAVLKNGRVLDDVIIPPKSAQ